MHSQLLDEQHVKIVRSHDIVLALVRRPRQKESEYLERHQAGRLTGRSDQFEYGTNSLLRIESRHHGGRELGQQSHEQLEHIVNVLIFVHRRQVVENTLQFILLAAFAHHDQLLEEEQDERADRQDIPLTRANTVQSFRRDSGSRSRIDDPVVILERVYRLQNCGDAAHRRVDVRVVHEIRGQVRVEPALDVDGGVDPERRIEQDVVEQLLQKDVGVGRRRSDQELCEAEEGVENVERQVISGQPLQQVTDDQESPILHHLLLHCGRTLHQLAQERDQLAADGIIAPFLDAATAIDGGQDAGASFDGEVELREEREEQLHTSDRVERVVHRVRDDRLHSGQHECVRSVHEVGRVAFRRRLQAQLAVRGHSVVHEHDRLRQLAIVEDTALIVRQVHLRLVLEAELALVAGSQAVHGAHLMRRQSFAEQVNGRHLAAVESIIVQFRSGSDVALVKRITRRYRPRHFGGRCQLAVDKALDLALGPPVVNVHDGQHVPAARLELVLDTVLESFAFHFGRRQHQTIAHEVGRVAESFARPETVQVRLFTLDIHRVDRVQPEPGGERETVLLRPSGKRWQNQSRTYSM